MRVTLLEKGSICAEASKACQGHLFLWELPAVNIQLAKQSKILYQQLAEELDIDFALRQTGSMTIADDEAGLQTLRGTLDELRQADVTCELLTREEFLDREPHVSPHIAGGAYFPEDAQVNPLLTTIALTEGAKALGAKVYINTEVTGLSINSSN